MIIGIGVDDAFVFFDHLEHEPAHGAAAPTRAYVRCLANTYHRTGTAMLVTSTTSACSFASNLVACCATCNVTPVLKPPVSFLFQF